ncbi:MAG: sulfate transporter family protein [Pseudorhodoplanes sp.]
MLDAVAKSLSQMVSPSFRRVLLKSTGLALILVVLVGIGMHRLLSWLVTSGEAWAEGAIGSDPLHILNILVWVLSIAAGLGIVVGAVFLMPAVTAFVGSFFVDEIGEEVERAHYPAEARGRALPFGLAITEGLKTALLAIAVYLCVLPFFLFLGFGFVLLFLATAYLLGREYFELAAMRYRTPPDAKAFRKSHRGTVFAAGLIIAAFVSIPIVNLATPLFAMALMVHMHKKLSGGRAELLERAEVTPRLR